VKNCLKIDYKISDFIIKFPEPLSYDIVMQLFEKLSSINGSWFKKQIQTNEQLDEMILVWSHALSGFSAEQINFGYRKLLNSGNFFLSNPIDFSKLCQPMPEDLGLPSMEKSYRLIMQDRVINHTDSQPYVQYLIKKYEHPMIFLVKQKLDKYFLMRQPMYRSIEIVKTAYQETFSEILSSGMMPKWPIESNKKPSYQNNSKFDIDTTCPEDEIKKMKRFFNRTN